MWKPHEYQVRIPNKWYLDKHKQMISWQIFRGWFNRQRKKNEVDRSEKIIVIIYSLNNTVPKYACFSCKCYKIYSPKLTPSSFLSPQLFHCRNNKNLTWTNSHSKHGKLTLRQIFREMRWFSSHASKLTKVKYYLKWFYIIEPPWNSNSFPTSLPIDPSNNIEAPLNMTLHVKSNLDKYWVISGKR